MITLLDLLDLPDYMIIKENTRMQSRVFECSMWCSFSVVTRTNAHFETNESSMKSVMNSKQTRFILKSFWRSVISTDRVVQLTFFLYLFLTVIILTTIHVVRDYVNQGVYANHSDSLGVGWFRGLRRHMFAVKCRLVPRENHESAKWWAYHKKK